MLYVIRGYDLFEDFRLRLSRPRVQGSLLSPLSSLLSLLSSSLLSSSLLFSLLLGALAEPPRGRAPARPRAPGMWDSPHES